MAIDKQRQKKAAELFKKLGGVPPGRVFRSDQELATASNSQTSHAEVTADADSNHDNTLAEFKKQLQADLKKNRKPRTGKEINREPASMKPLEQGCQEAHGMSVTEYNEYKAAQKSAQEFYRQELANTPPGQPKLRPPAPVMKKRD
jgi:hypothetical protein